MPSIVFQLKVFSDWPFLFWFNCIVIILVKAFFYSCKFFTSSFADVRPFKTLALAVLVYFFFQCAILGGDFVGGEVTRYRRERWREKRLSFLSLNITLREYLFGASFINICVRGTRTQPLICVGCFVHYWECRAIKKVFFEIAFSSSTHICLALRPLLTFCLTLTRWLMWWFLCPRRSSFKGLLRSDILSS